MKAIGLDSQLNAKWARVRGRLRSEYGEQAYRSWLKPLTLVGHTNGEFRIAVPTRFIRDWVMQHYSDRLRQLLAGEVNEFRAVEIVVDNFAFKPQMVRIKLGTTITWVNHDDIPHSIVCPSMNVHSHPMDTNESFSFTFTKAGFYNYICGLHPHMHGQIVVST